MFNVSYQRRDSLCGNQSFDTRPEMAEYIAKNAMDWRSWSPGVLIPERSGPFYRWEELPKE